MTAQELHELLANTMIEEFDPVEEAFKLLDVEGTGHLTVDTFRTIFEKLNLGTIEGNEEDIFKEVATKDEKGRIFLDDFRKILEDPDQVDSDPMEAVNENHAAAAGSNMDGSDDFDDESSGNDH